MGIYHGCNSPYTHAVSGGRCEIAVSCWDLVSKRGLTTTTFPQPLAGQDPLLARGRIRGIASPRRDEMKGTEREEEVERGNRPGEASPGPTPGCSVRPLLSSLCLSLFFSFCFLFPPYQAPSSAPVRLRLAWRWRRSFACSWRRRYTESWRRRPARRPGGWVRPVRPRSRAPCAPARWRLRGPRSPACPCSGTPRPR